MKLGRLVLYVRDVEATVAFYERYFGFTRSQDDGDRIVELIPADGGASLMIHPAAKSQKMGQALVKLAFDVEDIEAFCTKAAEAGLQFGSLHKGDGYVFANAKDPSGNSVSVSSRAFRRKDVRD